MNKQRTLASLVIAMIIAVSCIIASVSPAHAYSPYGGNIYNGKGNEIVVKCANGIWRIVGHQQWASCTRSMEWYSYSDRRYVTDVYQGRQRHHGWVKPTVYHWIGRNVTVYVHPCGDGKCRDSAPKYHPFIP